MNYILSRIRRIIEEEGCSIGAFERTIGASKGVISRAITNGTDIQAKWIKAIVENYHRYNAEWLITGEGEMLKSQNKEDVGTMMASEPQPAYGTTNRRDDSHLLDIIRQQAEEIGRLKEQLRTLKATAKANSGSPPND